MVGRRELVTMLTKLNGLAILDHHGYAVISAGGNRRKCYERKIRYESFHHQRCIRTLELFYEKKKDLDTCPSTRDVPIHNHEKNRAMQMSYFLLRWRCKLKIREDRRALPEDIIRKEHRRHPFKLDVRPEQFVRLMESAAKAAREENKTGSFVKANYAETVKLENRLRTGEFGPLELGKFAWCSGLKFRSNVCLNLLILVQEPRESLEEWEQGWDGVDCCLSGRILLKVEYAQCMVLYRPNQVNRGAH